MDYRILGMMHEHVPRNVELRQWLVETWTEFQRSIVGEAIEQWHNRQVVVSAQREVTSNTFYKK